MRLVGLKPFEPRALFQLSFYFFVCLKKKTLFVFFSWDIHQFDCGQFGVWMHLVKKVVTKIKTLICISPKKLFFSFCFLKEAALHFGLIPLKGAVFKRSFLVWKELCCSSNDVYFNACIIRLIFSPPIVM